MTRRSYSNVGPLDSEFTSPPLARKRCACALTPIRRHTAPIALKSLGKHSVALPPGEIGNVGPKWGDETPVRSMGRCNAGVQFIRWGLKAQSFSRSLVQLQCDFVQVSL